MLPAFLPDGLIVCVPEAAAPAACLHRRKHRETLLGDTEFSESGLRALLAQHGLRPAQAILRLPAAWLMQRHVDMPLAAEPDLPAVLPREMERLTPFAAAELRWSSRILRRDRTRGILRLLITLAQRALVDDPIDQLRAAGLRVALLEGPADLEVRSCIFLDTANPHRATHGRDMALAAACIALAIAVAALPFQQQSARLAQVEDRIAQLRPAVSRVEAMRRALSPLAAGNPLLAQLAATPQALHLLATITQLLPEDCYATSLAWQDGTLTLEGEATDGARLVSLLAAEPSLANLALLGPLTRGQGGRDHFSIRAEPRL